MFGRRKTRDDDRRDGGSPRLLARLARLVRIASFLCFGMIPLLLVWQLVGWVEVRFWHDLSIGSLLFPDPEVRELAPIRVKLINMILWIPLWFEFLLAGIVLFVAHVLLWNHVDAQRQLRRRARRSTPGYKEGQRRRRRDN